MASTKNKATSVERNCKNWKIIEEFVRILQKNQKFVKRKQNNYTNFAILGTPKFQVIKYFCS